MTKRVEYVGQTVIRLIHGRNRSARFVYHLEQDGSISEEPIRLEYKSDNGDWLHYVENPNDPQ